jgi:simple sugar transport system substrate-binding protein
LTTVLAAATAAVALLVAGCGKKENAAGASASPSGKKIVVGFAQTGAESAWRTANTESMKSEAAKRGIDLRFSDGQSKPENQLRAMRNFVAQHVDAIVLAPLIETGWDQVLQEAKAAHIPVIIMDRKVQTSDESLYTCFVGSDFATEGQLVADWLVKNVGKGRIIELSGEPGSAAANERHKAFADAIAKHPEFSVIDSQTGNFRRAEGKTVMEAMLKKHDHDFEILYSHNDDMALGAIQAIEEAGLKPGTDIKIVSIDAIKEGLEAVKAGKINCCVECNPLFGPKIYDTIAKVLAGEEVPKVSYNKDQVFDATNVAAALPTRQY